MSAPARQFVRNSLELVRLLGAPTLYLRVVNSRKRRVDYAAPLLAVVLGVPSLLYFDHINVFGTGGLVYGINGLLQLLTGFFITALAAIATFPGTHSYPIDAILTGEGAKIVRGDDDEEELSRRRFLCLLFGYLAFASLVLYLVGVILMMIAPDLHQLALGWATAIRLGLRGLFLVFYLPIIGHVVASTCLGLVFLSDRIPGGVDVGEVSIEPRDSSADDRSPPSLAEKFSSSATIH
jgi:hypothetical protein